jgi:hypothetical protein
LLGSRRIAAARLNKRFPFSVLGLRFCKLRFQPWLEAELANAQAEYAEGKTLVQASGGDASASKQVSMSLERRIQQILKALYLLDPVTYPAEDVIPVRVTRASF